MNKPDMRVVLQHYGADRVPEGRGWRAMRCPFHDDSHASASTNGEAFHCHACGVTGDAFAVIMQQESCTFRDALEIGHGIDTAFTPDDGRGGRARKEWSPPGRRGRRG